jgi:ABC-type multidrug transport system fused ATPase/permease subunit
VAAQQQDAFSRTFPLREWYAGLGRAALAWSVLHGALWALLLFELGLFLGLLVDRGRLVVNLTGDEAVLFELRTGLEVPAAPAVKPAFERAPADAPESNENAPPSKPAPAAPAPAPQTVERVFDDAGILPTVWRARNSWWGGIIAALYRSVPALRQNMSALLMLLAAGIVTWLLRVSASAQLKTTCRRAASEVATRLRRHLHRQALRLGAEDLDGRGLSGAKELFRDEATRVRLALFEWLHCGARCPWEAAFLIVAAASIEWLLTAQWTFFALVGWYLIDRGWSRAEHARRLASDRSLTELNYLSEGLAQGRLVRGYGMENAELERFQTRMDRYVEQLRVQDRIQDDPLWLRLAMSLSVAALAALLLYLLSARVLWDEITVAGAGVFLAAFGLGMATAARWKRLPEWRRDVSRAAEKIWRYLDLLPTVSQAVGAKFLQPLTKTLHYDGVTYRTPDDRVLIDRLDVQITGGRCYAVLSLDPLEPKAFGYLMTRFIEPQAGRILFDGEDIAWGTLESLRAETVYVSADDPPLAGTVLQNILAGRTDVSLSEATDAAKDARAHNFIARLPQGYDTVLGGADETLDAGQRFRLALARALLRNPSVLILEEPAGPLEEDTKQLLDDTYNRICPGRTVFFLPQRLSSVRRCDEIIFFQNGRIEAYGPHALLVKESPLYRHWEYVHFNEFRRDGSAG